MFCYEQNERAIYLAYIVDGPQLPQASVVSEMVAVNYYEQEPVSKIESYETKIQVKPNQYQTDYLGAGTQSYNY